MKTMGDRLRAARIAAGFKTARDAAIHHDWNESTYRGHEAGPREISKLIADIEAKLAERGLRLHRDLLTGHLQLEDTDADCPALMPPGSGACQGAPKRKVVPGDYNTLAKSSKSP